MGRWNGNVGSGFIAPFCLVIVSFYYLSKIPYFEDLTFYSREIQKIYSRVLKLKNEDSRFVLQLRHEEDILPKIRESSSVKIWVNPNNEETKTIEQIEIDGELVLKYNRWESVRIHLIFKQSG